MSHKRTRICGELLDLGFDRFNDSFANGERANNKLSIDHDRLKWHDGIYKRVLQRMCEIADDQRPRPTFFIGVPNGATGIAVAVSQMYGAHLLNPTPELVKDDETKVMSYADRDSSRVVRSCGKGIIIDDVFRTGSSIEKALALPYMAGQIVAGICVFDRSVPDNCLELPIDIHSVAQEPIPLMLPKDSELFRPFADGIANQNRVASLV